ncbi:MAG: metalloprotease PmbA, partial [Ottowia sp.]|nr:metalloprotease PmbA [Ottowia sp.]
MTHDQAHDAAPHGGVFSYTQEHFEALADAALAHAKKLGASDAAVSVSESLGLSVTARCGEPETV